MVLACPFACPGVGSQGESAGQRAWDSVAERVGCSSNRPRRPWSEAGREHATDC